MKLLILFISMFLIGGCIEQQIPVETEDEVIADVIPEEEKEEDEVVSDVITEEEDEVQKGPTPNFKVKIDPANLSIQSGNTATILITAYDLSEGTTVLFKLIGEPTGFLSRRIEGNIFNLDINPTEDHVGEYNFQVEARYDDNSLRAPISLSILPKNQVQVIAPAIDALQIVEGGYFVKWSFPPGIIDTPEGGFDLIIDGVDQDNHLEQLLLANEKLITGLDQTDKHCFAIQARWTQRQDLPEDEREATSPELCLEGKLGLTSDKSVVDVRPGETKTIVMSAKNVSGTPSFKLIGEPEGFLTRRISGNTFNLDISPNETHIGEYNFKAEVKDDVGIVRIDLIVKVSPLEATPPPMPGDTTVKVVAAVMESAVLQGEDYLIKWKLPEGTVGVPSGGYDLIIDGDDKDNHLQGILSANEKLISGLDTSVRHCFGVQARWSQLVELPEGDRVASSNQLCVDLVSSTPVSTDPNYPAIEEFLKAGVEGGIPQNTPVVRTINNSTNLQSAINDVANNGGGVLVLQPGTYRISQTLYMKSGVILRGASSTDTTQVIIESTKRGTDKYAAGIEFAKDINHSGLENLTYFYRVDGCEPTDDISISSPSYKTVYKNNPCGMTNLQVDSIRFSEGSSHNWVHNCNILESGSHAVRMRGNYNTVQSSFIQRSYNKSSGGRGYFLIEGDYNLVLGNVINRLRHFAASGGGHGFHAKYNVFVNNFIGMDVNFHDGDAGYNLVERNTVSTPPWHGWKLVGSGIPNQHQPPGLYNYFVNNLTNNKQRGPMYGDKDVIYTLTHEIDTDINQFKVVETNWPLPNNTNGMLPEVLDKTFYPKHINIKWEDSFNSRKGIPYLEKYFKQVN